MLNTIPAASTAPMPARRRVPENRPHHHHRHHAPSTLARKAQDSLESAKPVYDVDSLVGRAVKNTPDVEAYAQLAAYIRGQGLNRLDLLGRDAGLMVIIRTLVDTPISVYDVPCAASLAEMRLRLAVLATKAYTQGSNGFVDRDLAQGMYTALRKWVHVARGRFVGSGGLAFKMLEAHNIVSKMDAAQTHWQRWRHKAFDALLFGVIIASTFFPILAPTKTTYLPVLGAATAGNVVGLALLRDLLTRKPHPKKWYRSFLALDQRMNAMETGMPNEATKFAMVRTLHDMLYAPPHAAFVHMRTHAFQMGCLDLLQRMVTISDEPAVLHACCGAVASYLTYAVGHKHRNLLTQMGLGIAMDLDEKAPAAVDNSDVRGWLDRMRGGKQFIGAQQLRSARQALWDVGMPRDLDSLPKVDEGEFGHRLPR